MYFRINNFLNASRKRITHPKYCRLRLVMKALIGLSALVLAVLIVAIREKTLGTCPLLNEGEIYFISLSYTSAACKDEFRKRIICELRYHLNDIH